MSHENITLKKELLIDKIVFIRSLESRKILYRKKNVIISGHFYT